ncbi:MAG TPA: hypothetical protein VFM18_00745 [Methanosarcina sp.]|nr:hypothetical protein [Methanosarcina sp.]
MYFKDNNNQVFWYDDNQMDLVGDKVQMTDEEIELHLNPPKTAEQNNAEIYAKIAELEAKQPRALREAALGYDGATDRLKSIDDEISALRAELK